MKDRRHDAETHLGPMALDQWRGLALVLVLISHAFHDAKLNGLGRSGVNLFFFISGILVFRSLSRSRESSQSRVTLDFWFRRLRRLYPALLVYVAVMVPAQYWLQNIPEVPPGSDFANCLKTTPSALLYFLNYIPSPPLSLGHLWSLACEMQFYLLAPLIYFLGAAIPGRRTLFFGGLTVGLVGLGMFEPLFLANPLGPAKTHFEFAVWPMMAGFFCESQRNRLKVLPERWVKIAYRISLCILLGGIPLIFLGPKMKLPVIALGAFLLVPCLIAYERGLPLPAWWGRVLKWLGERTYSIYLWQQPLLACSFLPSTWWPLGTALAVVLGVLSFHWFERPFLSPNRAKTV